MRYAAFLRGINAGGHKQIRMGELREIFESLKFKKDEIAYVEFLPDLKISKLPIISNNNDVEVFSIKNGSAFSISRKVNGRYGF